MLRHEFQPGKLIAGAALSVAGVLYAADVAGNGDLPWWTLVPIVLGGLGVAAVVGMSTVLWRHARVARASSSLGPSAQGTHGARGARGDVPPRD
ncbi:hypothetical protein ACIQXD_16355 [Streptomyces uncialis]|uniref:hypothetical protein n=1 Tax=Streptomyces uncialis TaxID=1048205 RepID=UPI00382E4CF6